MSHIYILKHTYKTIHIAYTMACQSIPRITQKRESDFSYFHCGPFVLIASHSEAHKTKSKQIIKENFRNI